MFNTGFPKRWSTLRKLLQLRIMQGAAAVLQTVTGNAPLTLANAVARAIHSLTQTGLCTQADTPTPTAPVDILCNNGALRYGALGINLLDQSAANVVLGYYVAKADGEVRPSLPNFMFAKYMPVEPGKTYVAYGRAKSGGDLSDYNRIAWYDSAKTWIKGADYIQNRVSVVTAPENAAYARFSVNPSGTSTAIVTQEIVDSYNWMFAEGTAEITPFVPFVGGVKPVGTPEVLTVSGKNLNSGTIENKGYTSAGGESTSTTFAGTLCKIRTQEGEKFTVSWGGFPDGVSGVFINTWKTDGTWNARQAISASKSLTYTIGEGIGLVNFTLYKTGGITIGEDAWMQVEYGTEATEYKPFVEPQTASVPMLLSVGDYKDEAEIINGIKTGKVGVKVFDGTETIGTSNACFTIAINDRVTSKTALLCSHFPYSSKTSSKTDDCTIISFSSTNIGFRFDACADETALAAWLAEQYAAGTPVIVVYPLAEETTESVAGQALHTVAGTNTVSVTAEVSPVALSCEYYQAEA